MLTTFSERNLLTQCHVEAVKSVLRHFDYRPRT